MSPPQSHPNSHSTRTPLPSTTTSPPPSSTFSSPPRPPAPQHRTPAFASLHPQLAPVLLSAGAAVAGVIAGRLSGERGALDDGPGVSGPSASSACPKCDGRGTVPCLCTRWRFAVGDARKAEEGCGTCSGTRKARCPMCSGGGLKVHAGVPVRQPVPVRVDEGERHAGTRWLERR